MEADQDVSPQPDWNHDLNSFHTLIEDPNAIFSEKLLLDANKGLLKESLLTNNERALGYDTSRHEKIWNTLLRTARSPLVSNIHLTAACNAICGFLNAARASNSPDLRKFGQAKLTWLAAFDIYLHRYGDAKSKVMSQLLSTLSSALFRHPDVEATKSLKGAMTNALLKTIFPAEPVPTLKASVTAFDFMLRKGTMQLDQLLVITRRLLESPDNGLKTSEIKSNESSKSHGQSREDSTGDSGTNTFKLPNPLHALATALISNCFQTDVASIAAQSLSTLLDIVEQDPAKSAETEALQDICAFTLINSIQMQPSSLKDFRNHVFPVLFKENRRCFLAFMLGTFQGDGSTKTRSLNSMSELDVRLLFSALEIGAELGLLSSNLLEFLPNGVDDQEVRFDLVHRHLLHSSPILRLSATSLMVTSSQVTAPLTPHQLSALRNSIFFSHADPDPEVRSGILSLERRLIIRIRGAMSALSKKGNPATTYSVDAIYRKESEGSTQLYRAHHSFLEWYARSLVDDLCPAINYQKHVTALKALQMLLQSGLDQRVPSRCLSKLGRDQVKWSVHLTICSKTLVRNLLDLLLDPFDDVRSAALEILKLFPVTDSQSEGVDYVLEPELVRQALDRAEDLACKTGRADHADGVAQLHYLLFHVSVNSPERGADDIDRQQPLRMIVERVFGLLDTSKIVAHSEPSGRGSTVHGYLSTLRYLLSYPSFYSLVSTPWRELHQECMRICSKIWDEVRETLCIDSPEGQTDGEFDHDLGLGPKDLLSASWRALREASLLLHTIISTSPDAYAQGDPGLTKQDFVAVGELCFTQLAELRHRGAFSTVSQTFAACCDRCEKSKNPEIRALTSTWLNVITYFSLEALEADISQKALVTIDRQASRLTRRSAGLPAIVSGIVSANPGGQVFLSAMARLSKLSQIHSPKDEAHGSVRLPQVHALNCLKDVVTHTKLGASTEPFISALVELSIRSIESRRWAIRNCGLMLLRALISRMCQSSNLSSKSEDVGDELAKISYDKFTSLDGIVEGLLNEETAPQLPSDSNQLLATQKIFVALELVRRRLSSSDIGTELLERLLRQTSSVNWAIREQAAKAYASQTRRYDYGLVVVGLISREWSHANALHGALLTARHIVSRMLGSPTAPSSFYPYRTSKTPTKEIIAILVAADIYKYRILDRNCPYTAAVFWDIVCELVEHLVKFYHKGGYTPTLKRSCQFPSEWAWAENAYATSARPLLFLGFTKPLKQPASSLENPSYLRFLCLQFIIDHFAEDSSDKVKKAVWDDLHRPTKASQTFAPRALSGFEKVFEPLRPMVHSRCDLYSWLFGLEGPEQQKVVVLRNVADLYQRMDVLDLDGRSILQYGSILQRVFSWFDYPDLEPPGDKLASRDMYEVKICLEGSFTATQFSQFCEPEIDPETTQKRLDQYVTPRVLYWTKKVRLSGKDQNEASTRRSAAQSINAFRCSLRSPRTSARVFESFLVIYLAIYDILNDDDEEIRNLGAKTASWVLGGPDEPILRPSRSEDTLVSLLPLAASLRLTEFLVAKYEKSKSLFREALGRLTGQREATNCSTSPGRLQPFHFQLYEARKENTDLFAEEKQNLFIDEPREIVIWSTVLVRLDWRSMTDSADRDLISEFSKWTVKGIQCLTQAAHDGSIDGPLGWTSYPDVFVLGLRVIYAAKIVLEWAAEHSIPHTGALVAGLKELVTNGKALQLHDRWLNTARGALEDFQTLSGP